MIIVDTKYKEDYSESLIVNLTTIEPSNKFRKLSPYYPHGDILIPYTPNKPLKSVNDVWQKLCVRHDNSDGEIKYRKGLYTNEYLTYVQARQKILIPLYCWMLENKAFEIIEYLRECLFKYGANIVIIDKSVNCEIENPNEPLSFGFLLKAYIEGVYPYQTAIKHETESDLIMVGRKYKQIKRTVAKPQKISNIYTGEQYILDFD